MHYIENENLISHDIDRSVETIENYIIFLKFVTTKKLISYE
jgi:hypothetical protein